MTPPETDESALPAIAAGSPADKAPAARIWERHPRGTACLGLIGAWLAFFAEPISSPDVPYYRDLLVTFVPILKFQKEQLLAGHLPQWYPYEGLGVPFIGQIVTMTFHPLVLISLLLPPTLAIKADVILLYLVALLGAYRLSRILGTSRLAGIIAACSFAFGGYALAMSNNITYLAAMSTLPWVGWSASRVATRCRLRDSALLGICWALVFLAGDAQGFLIASLLILALGLGLGLTRRNVGGLVLGAVLATLLCSVELLPALGLASDSIRRFGQASPTAALNWALHPLRLLELVIPGFVPDQARGQIVRGLLDSDSSLWATGIFPGAIAILLSMLAPFRSSRLARAMLAFTLLLTWLALGEHGSLLPLLWKVLPVLSWFRFPEKYLAFSFLGLSILVGLGSDELLKRRRGLVLFSASGLGLLAYATVAPVALFVDWLWRFRGNAPSEDVSSALVEAWSSGLLHSATAVLACAGCLWLGFRHSRLLPAIALLLFVELWSANHVLMPMVPRAAIEDENEIARRLLASSDPNGPPPRVLGVQSPHVPSSVTLGNGEVWVRAMLLSMHAGAPGISHIDSFASNLPGTSYRTAMMLGPTKSSGWARFAPLFGVCDRVVESPPNEEGDIPIYRLEPLQCFPRAYLAAVQSASSPAEVVRRLSSSSNETTYWEGGPALGKASGEVRWLAYAPTHLQLSATASEASALVVNEMFATGWTATIDGNATPIFATNVLARGVQIPAGTHTIEMTYRSPGLRMGFALTLLGILLSVAAFWLPRSRTA